MKVWRTLEEACIDESAHPRVLTSGMFDGMHRAHRNLIGETVRRAHRTGAQGFAMALTFANHPLAVLAPPYAPKRLTSNERKTDLMEQLGLDGVFLLDFDRRLAGVSAEAFVDGIIVERLKVDVFVAGFDFRFGSGGEGDVPLLKRKGREHGFEVCILPALYHDEWPISSTRVRDLISEGRMRQAWDMLGRPYELTGRVIRGYGRGTELGYPTANLEFDPDFAIPPSGVYAVRASLNGASYGGMMNIGASPTFAGAEYRSEVHLFDFEPRDLYGERLTVRFVQRLREERAFASVRALRERLGVDERLARGVLESGDQGS